jgi:hypothetical protein
MVEKRTYNLDYVKTMVEKRTYNFDYVKTMVEKITSINGNFETFEKI